MHSCNDGHRNGSDPQGDRTTFVAAVNEKARKDSSTSSQPLSHHPANNLTRGRLDEPYPSPSSSFFSPPPTSPNKRQKTDLSPQATHRHTTPRIPVVTMPDSAGGPRSATEPVHGHKGPGEGLVKAGRRLSDPYGNRGGDITSLYDGMPTSSSTFRGNKHLSTGSPITTPTSAAYNLSSGSSRPPSGPPVPNRHSLGIIAKRLSLTSSRVAPASPTPSHTQSNRASYNYFPPTPLAPFPPQVPAVTHPDSDTIVLKIMDFGFQKGDKRRQMLKKIDPKNPPSPPPQAPGGFLGPLEPDEIAKLKMDGQAGSESGIAKDNSSEDGSYEEDDGAGHYTAMYDFDAEGSAEMDLRVGDVIQCLGRGGGEGWMVAVRPGSHEVTHALVPEGYLEFLRPLTSKEHKQAMARFSS